MPEPVSILMHDFAPTAPSDTPCLVIMLKSPARSKRRLAAEIGADAATAAEHLAACAFEDAAGWNGPVCLAVADRRDLAWARSHVRPGQLLLTQSGGNLGARINDVNRQLLDRGFTTQLFIGTDCPELDTGYLREAAGALRDYDAVLGPATDGGVVLMAARTGWPPLAALPWSTPALGETLAGLLGEHGWSVARLAVRNDVDELDALLALRQPLARDPRDARRALSRWLMTGSPGLGGRR
jgi:uncharacterized protein